LPTSDWTCGLNLRAELEDFELLDQDPIEVVHPRADVERFEDFLLDAGGDRRQRRGDEVGEPAGFGDVHRQGLQIVGEQRRQRHHLLEVRLDVAGEGIDLEHIRVVGVLGRGADPGPQIGLG